LAMPVPSPQSMATPTCFLELDFVTQPSHFHVPDTVTVRPAVVCVMVRGYGVSSTNVVLASSAAWAVSLLA